MVESRDEHGLELIGPVQGNGRWQQVQGADYLTRLETYVNQVEEVFRKEQGQWGELTGEIKSVEPPKPKG